MLKDCGKRYTENLPEKSISHRGHREHRERNIWIFKTKNHKINTRFSQDFLWLFSSIKQSKEG